MQDPIFPNWKVHFPYNIEALIYKSVQNADDNDNKDDDDLGKKSS